MRAAPSISSSYRKGLSEKRDEWRYSAKIYPMSLANDPFSTCGSPTGRSRSKKPLRLSWPMLYRQFGADPAKAGDNRTVQVFRTDCLRELTKIKTA